MSKQTRDECRLHGWLQHGGEFHNWIEFRGEDGHNVSFNLPKGWYTFGDHVEPLHTGVKYNYELLSDFTGAGGSVEKGCSFRQRLADDGRTLECEDCFENEPNDYQDLIVSLDPGYGVWVITGNNTGYVDIPDVCGEPEPPPEPEPLPPPTIDSIPPGANGGKGNCSPSGPIDPDMVCETGTILTTGYTDPTFFTHAFDPGMVRSVVVINPHDPNGRFLRITFDPHVCDVDEIAASLCLCTSQDANGDPIVEFGAVTVTKVDDYTIDVVIKGKIIETHGYKG